MVYYDIRKGTALLYFPHNGYPYALADLSLTVRNTVDKREVEMPLHAFRAAGFLVRMEVVRPEGVGIGEWEYKLANGQDVITTGLMVFYDGDKEQPIRYENDKQVIQYGG